MSASFRFYNLNAAGDHDIKMSFLDYCYMLDVIRDERLSDQMLLKFKHLYQANMQGIYQSTAVAVPWAIYITRAFTGKARFGISGYKFTWPAFMTIWIATSWALAHADDQKRLYTEILTDNSDDGTYVREQIRRGRPGLWNYLSPQLYNLGYRYPEINEVRANVEFPTEYIRI